MITNEGVAAAAANVTAANVTAVSELHRVRAAAQRPAPLPASEPVGKPAPTRAEDTSGRLAG